MLIDGQLCGDGLQKFERVKGGLVGEFQRRRHWKGQAGVGGNLTLDTKGLGGGGFSFKGLPAFSRIKISGQIGYKVALDLLAADNGPVFLNGLLVGLGILPGLLFAKGLEQVFIDQTVLAGNLGRGVLGLPGAYGGRFQQNGTQSLLLQPPRQ